ncbi:hypothetical protein HAX54_053121 [Datura stramonium]|uniref:Uncharacterized protein n=1 Tax=Datura stramonium TaxID=4076 RepID=A0ABS8WRQ1_DATST|nr:hypothetical protein [Datura stramonium]
MPSTCTSYRGGAIDSSFPLLKKMAITCLGFFYVSLGKLAIVAPSSALSSPQDNCLLAEVEATKSMFEVCNHSDFYPTLGSLHTD